MKYFWIALLILFFVPGFIEIYTATRLLRFLSMPGSKTTLRLVASNGLFDLLFSLGLLLSILFGVLVIELDFSNLGVLFLVLSICGSFIWWRWETSLHALWLLGIIEEGYTVTLPNKYTNTKAWLEYYSKRISENTKFILWKVKEIHGKGKGL